MVRDVAFVTRTEVLFEGCKKPKKNAAAALGFLLVTLVVVGLLVTAKPAHADTTFTVTKTTDTNDGTCDLTDCSLREAIGASNAAAGHDTITLPAGTYTLSLPNAAGGEDANATGDLDITGEVDVIGAGARNTIIDAGGIDRVFDHISGAAKISRLTVTGGRSNGGGGILSAGDLTLTEVAVDGNRSPSGVGGGIRHEGSTLIIERSALTNNSAFFAGFGFIISRTATIDNSTIANNTAIDSGGAVTENVAGRLVVKNSTIAFNRADSDNNGSGTGGAFYDLDETTFENTIVAKNTDSATSMGDENCDNPVGTEGNVSQGNNLEDLDTCGFNDPTDKPNVADPKLGALADNGGPTDTVALLASSLAIDAGDADVGTDQRGVTRPQDGDNNGTAIDDIGAFELVAQASPPPPDKDKKKDKKKKKHHKKKHHNKDKGGGGGGGGGISMGSSQG